MAFWTLHFLESGEFHYRYIIHGPLIQHVDRLLFAIAGTSDAVARLPVAVVGGLLPLTSLWLRHRLSETETIALAFLLTFNPLLLYYSRFMRSTLLVATFCFAAFAAFLRFYDGFGVRYFHFGMILLAFGFASKENAIIYVLCWLGATALLVDHRLFSGGERPRSRVADSLKSGRRRLAEFGSGESANGPSRAVIHLLGGLGLFALVLLFFYAPRGTANGLYTVMTDPANTLNVVSATFQDVSVGYGRWFGGSGETTLETFLARLGYFGTVLGGYAAPLSLLAIAGFFAERYWTGSPRTLVMGCGYWGLVSVPGYALGTDITAAWLLVNALVPLAVPAAVGLALIVRIGRESQPDDDAPGVAAVAVVLVLLVGQVGVAGISGVYLNPTSPENEMVQFAQPSQSMRPVTDEIARVSGDDSRPDVLVYGSFVDGQRSAPRTPACIAWFDTLPLGWYLEAENVETSCAGNRSQLSRPLPPVVVAPGTCRIDDDDDGTREKVPAIDCRDRTEKIASPAPLREVVPDGYERHTFFFRTTAKPVVVYIRDGVAVSIDSQGTPPGPLDRRQTIAAFSGAGSAVGDSLVNPDATTTTLPGRR